MNEVLDALASRFGTTVDHLWSVLLYQSFLNGIATIIWSFIWLSCVIFSVVGSNYCWKRHQAHADKVASMWDFATVVLWCMVPLTGIFAILAGMEAYKYLANPEYYAIKEIMGALKQ